MSSLVHSIRLDASVAPTNSSYVLLFVLVFFREINMISTFPIVGVAPVCNLKSKCTANYASTYHFENFICMPLM